MLDECVSEMKAKDRAAVHSLLVARKRASVNQIVGCQTFSSLQRLLNVTACVLRFVKALKGWTGSDGRRHLSSTLSPAELAEVEILRIKECQHSLAENWNFKDWKKQFDLFPVCGDVVEGSPMQIFIPFATKHLILLPKDHHVATLVVLKAHKKVLRGRVDGDAVEVLGLKGKVVGQDGTAKMHHMPEVEGKTVPCFATTTATKLPSTRGAPLYLHRCQFCRSPAREVCQSYGR